MKTATRRQVTPASRRSRDREPWIRRSACCSHMVSWVRLMCHLVTWRSTASGSSRKSDTEDEAGAGRGEAGSSGRLEAGSWRPRSAGAESSPASHDLLSLRTAPGPGLGLEVASATGEAMVSSAQLMA